MKGRAGDVIGVGTLVAMRAVRSLADKDGWAPVSSLSNYFLGPQFAETKNGYVRLTKDALTILEFSNLLESK